MLFGQEDWNIELLRKEYFQYLHDKERLPSQNNNPERRCFSEDDGNEERSYPSPFIRHGLRLRTDFMQQIRYIRCRILYCYWLLPLTDLAARLNRIFSCAEVHLEDHRLFLSRMNTGPGLRTIPMKHTDTNCLSEFMLNERASTWKGEKRSSLYSIPDVRTDT